MWKKRFCDIFLMMIMMMMMMMMIKKNCFCGMVDEAFRLFSAGTIVRDPPHRESLTHREQGLSLRRTCVRA